MTTVYFVGAWSGPVRMSPTASMRARYSVTYRGCAALRDAIAAVEHDGYDAGDARVCSLTASGSIPAACPITGRGIQVKVALRDPPDANAATRLLPFGGPLGIFGRMFDS